VIGYLDAVDLPAGLVQRDRTGQDLVMAAHDQALALAARAFDFQVAGSPPDPD
jgi:hypothetical protein